MKKYIEKKEMELGDVDGLESKVMGIYENIRYDVEKGEDGNYMYMDSDIRVRRLLMFRVMKMVWSEFSGYVYEDEDMSGKDVDGMMMEWFKNEVLKGGG